MNASTLIRSSTLVAFLAISTTAWSQQKFPFEITGDGVQSRYVQQHIINVDDVPGHQLRILEVSRTGHKTKIDGVGIKEAWVRGFSNYTNGLGPAMGYAVWNMEDGSKIFLEWSGTGRSEATAGGARRGTYTGSTKFTGGTGRFSKIRGSFFDVTEFDTDPKTGYSRESSKGEYWFEE